MGHIPTETVKKVAWVIIEKYYKCLGSNFHTNKHVCEEITIIASKKLHNNIVGCHTSDEADSERPCKRYLHQAAGGGERKKRQLCSLGLSSESGDH